MNIGENIKRLRKEKGLSQKEVAERLGVSPQMVAQYEQGKRIPKIATIMKICNALHVESSDLLGSDEFTSVDIKENPQKWGMNTCSLIRNETEQNLLTNYRSLNQTGQKKLSEYAADISELEKYKKD